MINRISLIILQENATSHIAQKTPQKLNELEYKIFLHLPYSTDLSPTDFYFFKYLDNFLSGWYFKNQRDTETLFGKLLASETKMFFPIGISGFVHHWQKCIDSHGFYFE